MTPQQIAAKHGIQNADAIVRAAAKVGLDLAVAFALVAKESGGRNVFGNDRGGMFKGEPVTEAKYRAMVAKVAKGATSNGVGVTQITHRSFFPQAEAKGLRLWEPYDNCLFGFDLLQRLHDTYGSWSKAGHRYNGAAAYGTDLVKKIAEWRSRLADAPTIAEPSKEKPMARKTWRGKSFDARTAEMLAEVARRTRAYIRPTQGSYNTSVGASAGTHAGGGAVDISVNGLTPAAVTEIVRVMRECGFAAWLRSPSEGPWGAHCHGIAIGCPDLAPSAARQVTAYERGLSGLASGKPDRHAALGIKPTTWEAYLKKQGKAPAEPPAPAVKTVVVKAGDTLSGIADRNGTTVEALRKLNGISNVDLIHPGQKVRVK